ncbi:MAG TPA: type VII secretion integral membrane protein EccD [Mycobacterium sp.]|nr:type VII secretion integral membrane protein EccD [Mycobacterium sp.]
MTAPSRPQRHTAAQPISRVQLCRVALLVGEDTEIDYTLPSGVPLIAVTEDLVPRINEQLRRRGRALLDTSRTYQLCRPDGRALDPQRSLDESGVLDGDLLWLMPTEATEVFEPVVENVSTAIARAAAQQFAEMDERSARRVAGWLTAALVVFAEAMLARMWWHSGGWTPAVVSWALTAVLAVTAWLCSCASGQRRLAADGFAWAALIPAGAAGAMSVPGHPGFWHVLLGMVVVLAGVVILVVLTGRHLTAVALVITVSVFAAAVAAVEASGWHVRPERTAVVAVLVVLLIVTFATNLGVIGSGVPMPVFPSVTEKGVFETAPGAPRDTVSPVPPSGAEPPESIAEWARRGNQIVTGVLIGAGIAAVTAAGYAVIPGRPGGWRFSVFTLAICLILLMRARSFVDRAQCTVLVVAASAAVAAVIGRYAFAGAHPSTATTLWCVAATVGVAVLGLLAGLVVPSARFTAPVRRVVEVSEYVLLTLVIPWALWLLGTYSAVRNMVHGG